MFQYRCTIRRVVDGDTVDVDIDLGFDQWIHKARIRLEGIDAAETRTRNPLEKAAGFFAKRLLQDLLPVGSAAILHSKKFSRGKFGRIMGDLSRKDVDISSVTSILKRRGAAIEYIDNSAARKVAQLENWNKLRDSGLIE